LCIKMPTKWRSCPHPDSGKATSRVRRGGAAVRPRLQLQPLASRRLREHIEKRRRSVPANISLQPSHLTGRSSSFECWHVLSRSIVVILAGARLSSIVGPQPHGEEIVWPGRGYLLT
jgi:hypothetical protein